MVPLGWQGLQCQLIISIISIVYVLIVTISYVNLIDCINPGVINCSALQLKDNSNVPTNSRMTLWGKKGEIFEVTSIYWNLQIFYKVCLRNK